MEKLIGLREFRENVEAVARKVKRGDSFVVIKRSKPVFKISQPETEERWKTVIDFTKINKKGIDARKVLRTLRKLNASS